MGRTRVIERLSGSGQVREGETPLCQAQYHLTVYQQMIDVGTGEIPSLKDIRGSISAAPEDIGRMFGVPKLSLHLQDGRWIDFFLKDTGGTITCTGGLYTRDR